MLVEPGFGIYSFTMAAMLSLVLSHFMVLIHHDLEEPEERPHTRCACAWPALSPPFSPFRSIFMRLGSSDGSEVQDIGLQFNGSCFFCYPTS